MGNYLKICWVVNFWEDDTVNETPFVCHSHFDEPIGTQSGIGDHWLIPPIPISHYH